MLLNGQIKYYSFVLEALGIVGTGNDIIGVELVFGSMIWLTKDQTLEVDIMEMVGEVDIMNRGGSHDS
jgi:hypothetical protein